MIIEIRKACLQVIDRIQTKMSQIHGKNQELSPKKINQIISSISNEIILLKDNFTLIMTKVSRLQTKAQKNEHLVCRIQADYRTKYDEVTQNYKILELKHLKMSKQLNFMKYSNQNLRHQIQHQQNSILELNNMKWALLEIQNLVSANSSNLKNQIRKIVQKTPLVLNFDKQSKILEKQEDSTFQKGPHKQFNSCDLNKNKQRFDLRTKKKSAQFDSDLRKEMDIATTHKKTKNELARLLQQQSRLTNINERYMSTNIV